MRNRLRTRPWLLGIGVFSLILLLNGVSQAQAPAIPPTGDASVPAGVPAETSSEASPEANPVAPSAPSDQIGIPYSTLFRNTGVSVPGTTEPLPVPGAISADIAGGESLQGHFSVPSFNASARLPFPQSSAFDKEKTHLKLGPLYTYFDSLTGMLMYSHFKNNPGDSFDRWNAVIATRITIVADVGERFNLALQGDFYYLPFENRALFAFGATPIAGILAYQLFPSFHSQIAYTIPVASWPVTFADDFRVVRGRYSDSMGYTFEDVRGEMGTSSNGDVYTFGRQTQTSAGNNLDNGDFTILMNSASISTHKQIPGDFAVSATLSRDDFWYSPEQSNLPSGLEQFSLSVVSEHEAMRFKPYLL